MRVGREWDAQEKGQEEDKGERGEVKCRAKGLGQKDNQKNQTSSRALKFPCTGGGVARDFPFNPPPALALVSHSISAAADIETRT